MKILLINSNQVVQKLIEVTTRKVDCEMLSLTGLGDLKLLKELKTYHLVVVDDESIGDKEAEFFSLCSGIPSVLLYSQYKGDISSYSYALKKPFLPNEFLKILVNLKQSLEETPKVQEIEEEEPMPESENFGNNILAEIDQHTEDEDFEQLLRELKIGEEIEETNQDSNPLPPSNPSPTQPKVQDFALQGQDDEDKIANKEMAEIEAMLKIAEESDFQMPSHELSGGILDLDEVQKVKDLLQQTQGEETHTRDLKILQAIFDRPIEEIREALDGMDIQINITLNKKD